MTAVAVTSLDIENHSQAVSERAACGGCRTASPNPSAWSSRSALVTARARPGMRRARRSAPTASRMDSGKRRSVVSGRDEGRMTSPKDGSRGRGGTAREAGSCRRVSGRGIADEVDVLTDEAVLGRAQRLTGVGQLPVRAGRRVRQFIRTRVEGCRLAQARVQALQLLAQLTLAGLEQLAELAGLGPEDRGTLAVGSAPGVVQHHRIGAAVLVAVLPGRVPALGQPLESGRDGRGPPGPPARGLRGGGGARSGWE